MLLKATMYPGGGLRRSARLSGLSSRQIIQEVQTVNAHCLQSQDDSPVKPAGRAKRAQRAKPDNSLGSCAAEGKDAVPKKPKLQPILPGRDLENELWALGHQHIAGVDEAGRGPLAGPVVAAACIIPPHVQIDGIRDSKKITEAKRSAIYEQLMDHAEVECSVQIIHADVIDDINILRATLNAMEGAVNNLSIKPDYILIDGNQLPKGLAESNCRAIIKGDESCLSIAAASILAKVTRDRLMLEYDKQYPQYGFAVHKGYGTKHHVAMLGLHGQCPIHRRSFKLKKPQKRG